MPAPKLIGTGRKVASRVLNPGEKGYREIDEAVREGRHVRHVQDSDRKWDRANGKVVAGLTATTTAAPLILLPPLNRGARKRTEAANAKAKTIRASIGKGVKVHRVSTLPPRKGVLDRLGRTTPLQASGLAMAGYGLGIGGMVVGSRGARGRLTEAERNLRSARREAKKAVAKSFPVRKGGRAFLVAGALTGTGSVGASRSLHQHGHEDASRAATAGAIGGWAGQGAYQAAGYGPKHIVLRAERKAIERDKGKPPQKMVKGKPVGPPPMTSSRLNRAKSKHAKLHGGKGSVEYYRNYPGHLPGGKANRVLGWTHRGKTGTALGAAATGVGTLGASRYVSGSQKGTKQKVSKALYQREERLSPLRVAQFGAGAGLAAWGLGRSRFLGAALARGVKAAQGKNNAQALEALQLAQAARGALRRGTTPAEHSLRQIRRVNTAINAVPAPFRPEIASAAGLLLAGHALPLHTTRYRQVSSPVGYGR